MYVFINSSCNESIYVYVQVERFEHSRVPMSLEECGERLERPVNQSITCIRRTAQKGKQIVTIIILLITIKIIIIFEYLNLFFFFF